MVRSEIVSTDPKLDVPADLRAGVERATKVLAGELGSYDIFDIDARWQYRALPSGKVGVYLSLTTPHEAGHPGLTDYPYDADVFGSDERIRHALDTPLWWFNRILMHLNKLDIKRLRERHEQPVLANALGG